MFLRRSAARARRPVDLALRGGAAHGAFTWGVLDCLLEERSLVIAGVIGTSAGAMNAVALASRLMEGGREDARAALRRLWERVARMATWHDGRRDASPATGAAEADAQAPSPPWLAPYLTELWTAPSRAWTPSVHAWCSDFIARTWSRYQLNPLNLNPLRALLAQTIDFGGGRRCKHLQRFISATHVKSGRLRIFRQHELSADVVLACACLPLLFQAVAIDGEAYSDGGFAGNPSLLPLINEGPADDLLLVQINPHLRESVPTTARDIPDRMSEVCFNTSLLKELCSIALMQQLIKAEGRPGHHYREPTFERVEALRVRRIDGRVGLAALGLSSKTDTRWRFLCRLHGLGREASGHWLEIHGADLGRRSTVDLGQEFLQ